MHSEPEIQATCGNAVMHIIKRLKLAHMVDLLEMMENLEGDVFDKILAQFRAPLPNDPASIAALTAAKVR